MIDSVSSIYYEKLIYQLAAFASPEQILSLEASDEDEERAEYLLEKNRNGILLPDEKLELAQMQYLDQIVGVLKAKALEQLSQK